MVNRLSMPIVTIYDKPTDHPNNFVARVFDMGGPTKRFKLFDDVDTARKWAKWMLLRQGIGAAMMHRDPLDDPKVVESWM